MRLKVNAIQDFTRFLLFTVLITVRTGAELRAEQFTPDSYGLQKYTSPGVYDVKLVEDRCRVKPSPGACFRDADINARARMRQAHVNFEASLLPNDLKLLRSQEFREQCNSRGKKFGECVLEKWKGNPFARKLRDSAQLAAALTERCESTLGKAECDRAAANAPKAVQSPSGDALAWREKEVFDGLSPASRSCGQTYQSSLESQLNVCLNSCENASNGLKVSEQCKILAGLKLSDVGKPQLFETLAHQDGRSLVSLTRLMILKTFISNHQKEYGGTLKFQDLLSSCLKGEHSDALKAWLGQGGAEKQISSSRLQQIKDSAKELLTLIARRSEVCDVNFMKKDAQQCDGARDAVKYFIFAHPQLAPQRFPTLKGSYQEFEKAKQFSEASPETLQKTLKKEELTRIQEHLGEICGADWQTLIHHPMSTHAMNEVEKSGAVGPWVRECLRKQLTPTEVAQRALSGACISSIAVSVAFPPSGLLLGAACGVGELSLIRRDARENSEQAQGVMNCARWGGGACDDSQLRKIDSRMHEIENELLRSVAFQAGGPLVGHAAVKGGSKVLEALRRYKAAKNFAEAERAAEQVKREWDLLSRAEAQADAGAGEHLSWDDLPGAPLTRGSSPELISPPSDAPISVHVENPPSTPVYRGEIPHDPEGFANTLPPSRLPHPQVDVMASTEKIPGGVNSLEGAPTVAPGDSVPGARRVSVQLDSYEESGGPLTLRSPTRSIPPHELVELGKGEVVPITERSPVVSGPVTPLPVAPASQKPTAPPAGSLTRNPEIPKPPKTPRIEAEPEAIGSDFHANAGDQLSALERATRGVAPESNLVSDGLSIRFKSGEYLRSADRAERVGLDALYDTAGVEAFEMHEIAEGGMRKVFQHPTDTSRVVKVYDPSLKTFSHSPEAMAKVIQREVAIQEVLEQHGFKVAKIDTNPELLKRGVIVQEKVEGMRLGDYLNGRSSETVAPEVKAFLKKVEELDPKIRDIQERYLGYKIQNNYGDGQGLRPVGIDLGGRYSNAIVTTRGGKLEIVLIDW